MKIDDRGLENLSKLSRIEISKKESTQFISQLGNIFDYVEKIQNYEICENSKNDDNLKLKTRKDLVIESDTENLITQFSDSDNNFLKVKKVL